MLDRDGNIIVWRFILTVVIVLVAIWTITAAVWGFGVATAGIYGRGEAHKQINSANFRIPAYDHFFNVCSSIQGMEGNIDELTAQYNATTNERDKNIVLASLTGVKAARHQAIASYNADARKDYTEGQFRDSDLPFRITDSDYPKEGGKTSCGTN